MGNGLALSLIIFLMYSNFVSQIVFCCLLFDVLYFRSCSKVNSRIHLAKSIFFLEFCHSLQWYHCLFIFGTIYFFTNWLRAITERGSVIRPKPEDRLKKPIRPNVWTIRPKLDDRILPYDQNLITINIR